MAGINELEQHLETVKKSNRSIVKDFEYLSTFDSREVFNTFQEEAAALIEEAQAMTGPEITQEGIKNKIRSDIQELSEQLLNDAETATADYRERKAATIEKLEKAIHSQDDAAGENASQIALRSSELQGEVRGKLYSLQTAQAVEAEFKRLVDQSQYDKTLARFLSKNYYLFLDHIKELKAEDFDKQRTIHSISQAAERVKQNGYSEKENALLAVRDSLQQREFSTTGAKLNIQQQARVLLKKYQ